MGLNVMARRIGVAVVLSLALAQVPAAMADEATGACPPAAAPRSDAAPRVLPLKEAIRLPNRPNATLEGAKVVTEGYLIRTRPVRPATGPNTTMIGTGGTGGGEEWTWSTRDLRLGPTTGWTSWPGATG